MNWLERLLNFFKRKPLTGAMPDLKDSRDYKFRDHFTVGSFAKKSIPSLYDWGALPNQGRTNSCVGFSLARLLEVMIYQTVKEETGNDYYYQVSELFFWYLAREMEGTETKNVGVYPRDAFKALFSN